MLAQLVHHFSTERAAFFLFSLSLLYSSSLADSFPLISPLRIINLTSRPASMPDKDQLRVIIYRRLKNPEGAERDIPFREIEPGEPVFSHLCLCIYQARQILRSTKGMEAMIHMAQIWWDSYSTEYMPFSNREDAETWIRGTFLPYLKDQFPSIVVDESVVYNRAIAVTELGGWAENDWAKGLLVKISAEMVDRMENIAEAFAKKRTDENRARYQQALFIVTNVVFHEVGGHIFSGCIRRHHRMREPTALRPPLLNQGDVRFDLKKQGEAGIWMEHEVLGGMFDVFSMHQDPMYGIRLTYDEKVENRQYKPVCIDDTKASLGLKSKSE